MSTCFGTRALITGGSRGIGAAYAEALAESRCSIVINHCGDGDNARQLFRRLETISPSPCHEIEADVAKPEAAREMVHRAASLLGGLDIKAGFGGAIMCLRGVGSKCTDAGGNNYPAALTGCHHYFRRFLCHVESPA